MLENNKKKWFFNMKFEKLMKTFNNRPFFELREVQALFDDSSQQIKNQLSSWKKQGKLLHLRRGKYLLAKAYRKTEPSVYYISNYLYRPSYVSLHTALQFYSMIPEAVVMIQALTPRHGGRWETELGVFNYRSIKQERFWGYDTVSLSNTPEKQNSFFIAGREKTLLDLFYCLQGEWTKDRLREMRFQNLEKINSALLRQFTERFASPRVSRAVERLYAVYEKEIVT